MLKSRWTKVAVFLASLAPFLWLVVGAYREALGANPIEYITHSTGDWTLRFLLMTLAITPARRLLNQPDLIRFRRMLGLWAFFYGSVHLLIWMWLDRLFDPQEMWADFAKRRYITAGVVGFLLMVPLALTSTQGWIRRLGKNWTRLHRLIYVSAVAGVVHYWWLVKSDIRLPLVYGVILAVLLGLRFLKTRRRKVSVVQGTPPGAPEMSG
ncbi:MAG TPA: protein-methionine-sulfoxide reductase heme-binding subunit MsrQ [Bryobacteraceae bacterium]|nr:protein-methionine-sulfoxide reductase heme-binding subunit MsrQ [Bryobacteraceae bacterium]